MADLMDLLQSQLSGSVMETLSSNLGAKNKSQAQSATSDALNILLNGLARNSSTSQGASALAGALDRDHDGSVLDDLAGILMGNAGKASPRSLDGAGILGHILGNRQDKAVDVLSKRNGLSQQQTIGLLIKLAPVIMGVLGKMKKSNQLDTHGLPDILSGAASKSNQREGSIFESLLDTDGDGNLNNEIKKVGFSFLRSLFKR